VDPALQELISEGAPEDEVAVVVRLQEGVRPPAGLRLVACFGTVATGRATRASLRALHADPAILSLKAPRLYGAELEAVDDPVGFAIDTEAEILPGDTRRPPGLAETGRGTVICVIDWSIDIAHPDFRNPDGSTRLLALWDQRGSGGVSPRYGYGRVHDRAAINRALRQADPFAALGYACADRGHGSHVLGIAAGNGRAGGPEGVAPEADIVFVNLGTSIHDFGNSCEVLEACDFGVAAAGERPLVFNMSLGRHAGPHDGTVLIERAIDWLLVDRPGTAVVQSTGNYYSRATHMNGRVSEARTASLPFHTAQRDDQPITIEIWYKGADEFSARVEGPGGAAASAPLGGNAPVTDSQGREVGRLYHRRADPNNGDNLIDLFLQREARSGDWEIEIEGVDVVDGRWHAWIERNAACPPCQAQFRADAATPDSTTGSICNALRTIAVGAYDAHDPARSLPPFSSVGPTRDGRRKPLLSAPGVRVLSVSSRADPSGPPGYVRMSGTSMASPHVAGTLALMMQAAGRQRVSALRRTLFATLAAPPADDPRWGYGQLDIAAAVAAARALGPPPASGEAAEFAETTVAAQPTIRQGSSGPAVARAQSQLNQVYARRIGAGESAIDKCPLNVDGRFGPNTRGATYSFQRVAFSGVPSEWDGVIGPKTWAMLDLLTADRPPVIPRGPPIIVPVVAKSETVPVILLPGVMGTRLRFIAAPKLPKWDPDADGEMAGWFTANAADKLAGLNMSSGAEILADSSDADEHRRGWDTVAQSFYRPMLLAIEQAFNTPPLFPQLGLPQLRCPVWAMGYDWRRSCKVSAELLGGFVARVLEVEKARQVILLTHSMGGLVARAALSAGSELEASIRGVIHVFQPSVGAVVAARRFRTGFDKNIDGSLGEALAELVKESIGLDEGADGVYDEGTAGKKFLQTRLFQAIFSDRMFNPNPEFYARMMAVVAGPNELLPSDRADRLWWPHARARPGVSVYDLYSAGWDQNGLIPPGLSRDPAGNALRARFGKAKDFHQFINDKYHPVTGVIWSDGLTTDTTFEPDTRPKRGDGTVPAFSSTCPNLANPHFSQRFERIEHAACFKSKKLREAVLDGIDYIAGGGPSLGATEPPKRIRAVGTIDA